MLKVSVEAVRINLATQQRVVILKVLDQKRYLCIWIAHAEAYAIAVQLQGIVLPRPLTHDFLKQVLAGLGARVVRVIISNIVDEIFYTQVVLDADGKVLVFDARPSDGIALAVRTGAPIFVEEHVLAKVGFEKDAGQNPALADFPPAGSEPQHSDSPQEKEQDKA
jgi:uncharacterized protein